MWLKLKEELYIIRFVLGLFEMEILLSVDSLFLISVLEFLIFCIKLFLLL